MTTFTFTGNQVGALASANDDGNGGVNLELDDARNLSGGTPWYSETDVIEISIPGSDIGPNGEFQPGGGDDAVTVNWIKVNGVKITTDKLNIKFGGGSDTYDSDAFFYVEGIDLVFLAPQAGITFDDTDTSGSPPILNIPERVADLDLNEDGDAADAGEAGNGMFNIYAVPHTDDDEDDDDGGLLDNLLGALTDRFGADALNNLLGGNADEYLDDLLDGIEGSEGDDTFSGGLTDDTISGGSGNDNIEGDDGDDLLMGDLTDSVLGQDATAIDMSMANLVGVSYLGRYEAQVGDFSVYRDVATLADGTSVSARLVLTDLSDPGVKFGLAAVDGYEMAFHSGQSGAEASVRMEFFDPVTGQPISLNGVMTFNDLDADNSTSFETVTLDTNSFSAYAVTDDSSLNLAESDGGLRFAGTTSTTPDDQGAWLSAKFQNQTAVEFTLSAKNSTSGFSFFGDIITDPNFVPIDQGADTLSGGEGADTIYGEGGDDVLDGGADDDVIFGGDGEDILSGGDGSDILSGNAGADTIYGGAGSDYIQGGEGADVLYTGIGDDTLDGGDGDDILYNSSGDDSLVGGAGADKLVASSGDDTLEGGTGDDTLIGGIDDDSLMGGDGDDILLGDFETPGLVQTELRFAYEYYELDSAPTLGSLADAGFVGGTENTNSPDGEGVVSAVDPATIDTFHTGNGATYAVKLASTLTVTTSGTYTFDLTSADGAKIYVDGVEVVDNDGTHPTSTVSSSTALTSGEHLIEVLYFVSAGPEELSVDLTGPDTGGVPIALEAADLSTSFDDILEGGTGTDTITGGLGDDTFIYNVGDGNDTITDFNTGNTGTLQDGDSTNNDFIDLGAFYDSMSELYADQTDDGVLNQSNALDHKGRAVDYTDNSQFGTGGLTFTGATGDASFFTVENTGITCFTAGTLILTSNGEVPVQCLKLGDLLQTRDNGLQPILWIGAKHLSAEDLTKDPDSRPIVLSPDLSGGDRPLMVSPQHGLLLNVDGSESFVRAKHLEQMKGGRARVAFGRAEVTYFHVMLPRHEVIVANGSPTESFYPGIQAVRALTTEALRELEKLCPDLLTTGPESAYGLPARPFSKRRELPRTQHALVAFRAPKSDSTFHRLVAL